MRAHGSPCHRECLQVDQCQTTRDCHFSCNPGQICPSRAINLPFRKHLKMFLKNNLRNPPFSRSIYPQLPFHLPPTPFHLPPTPFHLPPNFFLQLGKTDNFGIAGCSIPCNFTVVKSASFVEYSASMAILAKFLHFIGKTWIIPAAWMLRWFQRIKNARFRALLYLFSSNGTSGSNPNFCVKR